MAVEIQTMIVRSLHSMLLLRVLHAGTFQCGGTQPLPRVLREWPEAKKVSHAGDGVRDQRGDPGPDDDVPPIRRCRITS